MPLSPAFLLVEMGSCELPSGLALSHSPPNLCLLIASVIGVSPLTQLGLELLILLPQPPHFSLLNAGIAAVDLHTQ
jgi:hypothetical protein